MDGEIAVVTKEQVEKADYNLSPSRWAGKQEEMSLPSVADLLAEIELLHIQDAVVTRGLFTMLAPLADDDTDG